jgi:hypothetical protein
LHSSKIALFAAARKVRSSTGSRAVRILHFRKLKSEIKIDMRSPSLASLASRRFPRFVSPVQLAAPVACALDQVVRWGDTGHDAKRTSGLPTN